MRRESRPADNWAASNLTGAGRSTWSILPQPPDTRVLSARAVATVRLERFSSPHDISRELWYRTAMLKPGTTVRLEVGRVWPPRYLSPDVRTDLAYAIDTDRGDIADAWIECLERAAAMVALA